MRLDDFIERLNVSPDQIEFEDTMSVIDNSYNYSPVAFSNGDVSNQAGENEGSCKLLYFAQLNNISEKLTLHCFGRYYRNDVLNNLAGQDHQNIRNFMQTGWSGIAFQGHALEVK